MSNKVPRPALAVPMAVIDLSVENDVELELGLHKRPGAMTTLEVIADHGGEIGWNWEGGINPNTGLYQPLSQTTRELVADLINMGVLKEREHVSDARQTPGTGKLTLALTDRGRNVVAKHRARKVTMKDPRTMSAEEVRELK